MTTEKKEIGSGSIVGLFFVGNGDDGPLSQNQGRIVAYVVNGFWLVQLFSWMDGQRTCQRLASLADLASCTLHVDVDSWREAGDALTARNLRPLSEAMAKR
jgi:hypothetical protein